MDQREALHVGARRHEHLPIPERHDQCLLEDDILDVLVDGGAIRGIALRDTPVKQLVELLVLVADPLNRPLADAG